MKKILTTLLTGLISITTWAQSTTVQIVWPFAPGSTQAVLIRNLLDTANQNQSKYNFVFANKPGAGGSIAANSVLNANTLTVLASTSSFYSRPLMYKESHDVDQFTMVGVLCERGPVALFSKKYKTFDEAKNHSLTVGIIPGSITQLLTQLIQKNNPELKFVEVPYKDTPTAVADMLGGHIDSSVDLISIGNLARLSSDAKVIGITGNRNINGLPNFSSMGVRGLNNLTNSYYFWVPKITALSVQKELNQIFNSAITAQVREGCANEFGTVEPSSLEQLSIIDRNNRASWANLTQHIEKQ